MAIVSRLTNTEWRLLAALLPGGRQMRSRLADRTVITALFHCLAADIALEHVPHEFGIGARTLRTRQSRLKADGAWPRLVEAGGPAIERMRRELVDPEDLLERCARVFGWDLR
jgi:transposase